MPHKAKPLPQQPILTATLLYQPNPLSLLPTLMLLLPPPLLLTVALKDLLPSNSNSNTSPASQACTLRRERRLTSVLVTTRWALLKVQEGLRSLLLLFLPWDEEDEWEVQLEAVEEEDTTATAIVDRWEEVATEEAAERVLIRRARPMDLRRVEEAMEADLEEVGWTDLAAVAEEGLTILEACPSLPAAEALL